MNINFIVIAIYVIVGIFLIGWGLINKGRSDHLSTREKMVSQRECLCDRRCEIIESAENDIESRYHAVSKWMKDAVRITACYVITESDELKFISEQDIYEAARDRMAHNIAHEIIKRFEPRDEKNEFGRTRLMYRFKVVEDK